MPKLSDITGDKVSSRKLSDIVAESNAPVMVGGEDVATMPAWKNAAYGLVSPVADAMVGVGQLTGLMDDKTARESLARIDAVRSRTPGRVAGIAGDVGLFALAPEAKLANAGKLARYGSAALTGAGLGGVQGVRDGESRAGNVALGATLNSLGQGAADVLMAGGKAAADAVKPEVRALAAKAKQMGIDLTPAQLSDSRLMKFMQSQFGLLPFSGAASKAEAQSAQFNRKLAQQIGVDAERVTPEVYAAKKAADSAQFNDLTARNNLTVTGQLAQKLHAIQQQAKVAGKDVHDAVTNAVEGLYAQMTPDGMVPGTAYQALDSALGQVTKLGTPVSHFVGRVKSAIRDAMDDSISPADKAAWDKLRKEYGNRKTIRDLVAKADGGDIPPHLLKGRVLANNAGKEAMASGTRGAMGDLATIGSRMKPPPSSGTGERVLVNQMANPLNWPGLFLGASAGRVVNSPLLAQMMLREGRGQVPQALAPYARSGLAGLLMAQSQGDN